MEINFISSIHRVIFFLLFKQTDPWHEIAKSGKDVINVLTSEDMEYTPLGPRMKLVLYEFHERFTFH